MSVIDLTEEPHGERGEGSVWSCRACTLRNPPGAAACEACGETAPAVLQAAILGGDSVVATSSEDAARRLDREFREEQERCDAVLAVSMRQGGAASRACATGSPASLLGTGLDLARLASRRCRRYWTGAILLSRLQGESGEAAERTVTQAELVEPAGLQHAFLTTFGLNPELLFLLFPKECMVGGELQSVVIAGDFDRTRQGPGTQMIYRNMHYLRPRFGTKGKHGHGLGKYGLQHSKLWILQYPERTRFVISSANLCELEASATGAGHISQVYFVADIPKVPRVDGQGGQGDQGGRSGEDDHNIEHEDERRGPASNPSSFTSSLLDFLLHFPSDTESKRLMRPFLRELVPGEDTELDALLEPIKGFDQEDTKKITSGAGGGAGLGNTEGLRAGLVLDPKALAEIDRKFRVVASVPGRYPASPPTPAKERTGPASQRAACGTGRGNKAGTADPTVPKLGEKGAGMVSSPCVEHRQCYGLARLAQLKPLWAPPSTVTGGGQQVGQQGETRDRAGGGTEGRKRADSETAGEEEEERRRQLRRLQQRREVVAEFAFSSFGQVGETFASALRRGLGADKLHFVYPSERQILANENLKALGCLSASGDTPIGRELHRALRLPRGRAGHLLHAKVIAVYAAATAAAATASTAAAATPAAVADEAGEGTGSTGPAGSSRGGRKMLALYVGSHNCSETAWGRPAGSSPRTRPVLNMNSYELGVIAFGDGLLRCGGGRGGFTRAAAREKEEDRGRVDCCWDLPFEVPSPACNDLANGAGSVDGLMTPGGRVLAAACCCDGDRPRPWNRSRFLKQVAGSRLARSIDSSLPANPVAVLFFHSSSPSSSSSCADGVQTAGENIAHLLKDPNHPLCLVLKGGDHHVPSDAASTGEVILTMLDIAEEGNRESALLLRSALRSAASEAITDSLRLDGSAHGGGGAT